MNTHELRQLDRKIAEMLGWRIEERGENFYKQKLYHVWTPEGKQVGYWDGNSNPRYTKVIVALEVNTDYANVKIFPSYTTDLNAAFALWKNNTPNGLRIRITPRGSAAVAIPNTSIYEVDKELALALCRAWIAWKLSEQAESETTP